MEQAVDLDISFAKKGELSNTQLKNLVKLIIDVYKEAESGMWKDSFKRTTVDELKQLIAENKVMLARYEGKVIGSTVVE